MRSVVTERHGREIPIGRGVSGPEGRSRAAKIYRATVAVATAVAAFVPLSQLSPDTRGWPTFFVLAICAAVAQLFVVYTPRNQSYHTTHVFLIPAALLLPPALVALLGLVF